MKKENYQSDLKGFWENRKKAREERDKQLAELPFSDKVAITESLQKDAKAIESATSDSIGLWVTSPDAVNEIFLNLSFTQEDFEEALNKVFPFTETLRDEQELSRT